MINPECMSYYLALRYIPFDNLEWIPGVAPRLPRLADDAQTSVGTVDEILAALKQSIARIDDPQATGIFLSGGIDSAILAALLPKGTRAYTIDFEADAKSNEVERAQRYADAYGLDLSVVKVTWDDYIRFEPGLMAQKKAPLHAVEVALHKAALQAHRDGISHVLVGNGADSTFGGMDKLLSRDWTYDDFVARYTFIQPGPVLKTPVDIHPVYEPYRRGNDIDTIGFLKKVHGFGIIQAFQNAVENTGVDLVEPYEELQLKGALDLARIRRGEPKYLLTELFARLYPQIPAPAKVPFARPMDQWLATYAGPIQPEFAAPLPMQGFSGDQKYLIRCLDQFAGMLKKAPHAG